MFIDVPWITKVLLRKKHVKLPEQKQTKHLKWAYIFIISYIITYLPYKMGSPVEIYENNYNNIVASLPDRLCALENAE